MPWLLRAEFRKLVRPLVWGAGLAMAGFCLLITWGAANNARGALAAVAPGAGRHCGGAGEVLVVVVPGEGFGHRHGQGWSLADLALLHARLRNNDLARGYARQALEVAPEAGDPAILAVACQALGLMHSRLGEHRQATSCYRQALARARERKTPMARFSLGMVLAGYGDACRRAGDLPAAVEAWQQALQILDDLGLPDNLRIRPRLERARSLSPPG